MNTPKTLEVLSNIQFLAFFDTFQQYLISLFEIRLNVKRNRTRIFRGTVVSGTGIRAML